MKNEFVLDLTPASYSIICQLSPEEQELPFFLQSLGFFTAGKNYRTKRQGLKSYLLLYTLAGCGQISYRQKTLKLPVNHTAIIDCRQPHDYFTDKSGIQSMISPNQQEEELTDLARAPYWHFLYFHFYGDGIHVFEKMINAHDFSTIHVPGGLEHDFGEHLTTVIEMAEQQTGADQAGSFHLSIALHRLLSYLVLLLKQQKQTSHRQVHYDAVAQAIAFMEQSYSLDLNLDQIAGHVKISKYHFSRIFKEQTGFAPYSWLTEYRIRQAKNDLRYTDQTIAETAWKNGFKDAGQFIRCFRGQTGLTPLQYRYQHYLL